MSTYAQKAIAPLLKAHRAAQHVEARHIEAMMRLDFPTLNGLSKERFDAEAVACIREATMSHARDLDELAESFGL